MQGGVENAVGGTEPAQEGSSLLCWGAQGMGSHWRDFTSEEHSETCIFRRISSEESDLENRPQEGRPVCNTPGEWQWVPGIHWGNFFFPSDILTFTLSEKAKMLDGAHRTPTSQACDKVPHTHTNSDTGKPPRRGFCPSAVMFLCQTVPSDDTWRSEQWQSYQWDLYPVLDQEKQTLWYSPAKEALAACPIGRVSWPLNRFPLLLHNPLGPRKDWEMGGRVQKGCVTQKTNKSGFKYSFSHGFTVWLRIKYWTSLNFNLIKCKTE